MIGYQYTRSLWLVKLLYNACAVRCWMGRLSMGHPIVKKDGCNANTHARASPLQVGMALLNASNEKPDYRCVYRRENKEVDMDESSSSFRRDMDDMGEGGMKLVGWFASDPGKCH